MAALPLFGVLVSLEFCPVVLWCFRLDLGSNLAVVVAGPSSVLRWGGGGCRKRSVVAVVVFGSGAAGAWR
ncbi:hypothetical protein TSUD_181350 [Trifolium subterraneum]|uniref:Uncharacterized protein n=1 Tax=Trifolium subterraneum TaxID=3900 RepID=A0A2Z6LXX2_TRISU|nr:hypothetical protein TSUD_181350 [Trifolium subterraneum]